MVSVKVKNDVMVAADRGASSGLRYKHGRNLNTNQKYALIIKDPSIYRLPKIGHQPSYIIAKGDNYFVYPNDANKYHTKFKNSFQQGISTPGINRGIFSDTYITIKSIEDEEYKLIFKKNMGIQIIWFGLLITALSQIWKTRYVFSKK